MNLKDEVRKIVQLQKNDTRIYDLRQEKDIEIPEQLNNLKNELEQTRGNFSVFQEKVKKIQLKRKDKEIDLAAKEENFKKAQGHLYQLKTNKEYQAKLNEIGSIKADISIVEEDLLMIFDEVETEKKEFDIQKEHLSRKEEDVKTEEEKLKEQIKDIEAQMKDLEDKRKIFIKGCAEKILSTYEQLLKTRRGLAVVSSTNDHCGACHMLLTPQKINEIKMYSDLVLCDNCVRILYIPEDIRQ